MSAATITWKQQKVSSLIGILSLVLVMVALVALSIGQVTIPLKDIVLMVFYKVGLTAQQPDAVFETVLWSIRLPRIVMTILIGAALIIYYTLLLSFSEQVGYNSAYAIASIATTILVTLYSTSFLKSKSVVLLFGLLMVSFYTFIFIIIQAQDFSLLIGSIGLFLIIGLLMYFSRNIKWYGSQS